MAKGNSCQRLAITRSDIPLIESFLSWLSRGLRLAATVSWMGSPYSSTESSSRWVRLRHWWIKRNISEVVPWNLDFSESCFILGNLAEGNMPWVGRYRVSMILSDRTDSFRQSVEKMEECSFSNATYGISSVFRLWHPSMASQNASKIGQSSSVNR